MNKCATIFFIIILTLLPSCFRDNPLEPLPEISNSELMLVYLETHGNFINSTNSPSLISPEEVNMNLEKYLLLDIREKVDFTAGHIANAKNIEMKNLFDYIKSVDTSIIKKIVIISNTGQSSGYAACLLRLYGYQNVYSMNLGMGIWHSDFVNKLIESSKNARNIGRFTHQSFPKLNYVSLPALITGEKTIDKILESRIKLLLEQGWDNASIDIDTIMNTYNTDKKTIDYFVICYGSSSLYRMGDYGHPPGAVLFQPRLDLNSSAYLQTIPNDQKVAVYDSDGQTSAYVVAYLRLLGYDAKSILGGARSMSGEMCQWRWWTCFKTKQFDYVTGG
ncbi:MAG: rhodanese-like domain-containing protein [Ignavibacteria bacterium]|nr:rhodanese-like domain-containing protein [Ignavibacteria bacterium]